MLRDSFQSRNKLRSYITQRGYPRPGDDMNSVLLIDAAGSHYFHKVKNHWQAVESAGAQDRLWVLVDLPEEMLEVIDMPQLFGSDRTSFIERKLSNTLQGARFKAALALGSPFKAGKLMLNGLAQLPELDTTLEKQQAKLVGVWGMAALLGLMAQKFLPPDAMLVLPSEFQLRILVIKNRVPVLTRCVQHDPGNEQSEIQLTRQYLDNQRMIERGKPLPLLYLGDTSALGERLSKTSFTLIPPPKNFAPDGETGWRHGLFERLITSPPCQLAPLQLRVRHLGSNLKILAYLGAVACVATALFVNEAGIRKLYELNDQEKQVAAELRRASEVQNQLTESIRRSGADPELVRRAAIFEIAEIKSAPSVNDFLQVAATAIVGIPGARIRDLNFHAVQPTNSACIANAAPALLPDGGGEPKRVAEILLGIQMPADKAPSALADMRKQIAATLASAKGVHILQSPLNDAQTGILKGGYADSEEKIETWCVSLEWKIVEAGSKP